MTYITLTSSTTASFAILGYELNTTTLVFLSANSSTINLPSLTTVDFYSFIPSATARGFTGFTGSSALTYVIDNNNVLTMYVCGLTGIGLIDVIFGSVAGYTLMSSSGNIINMTG